MSPLGMTGNELVEPDWDKYSGLNLNQDKSASRRQYK